MSGKRPTRGVAGLLNGGSFNGEFSPCTDDLALWGMHYYDASDVRVELHPEGTDTRIAELEQHVASLRSDLDSAHGVMALNRDAYKAAKREQDGYDRIDCHEWHFECAGFSWVIDGDDKEASIVPEDCRRTVGITTGW